MARRVTMSSCSRSRSPRVNEFSIRLTVTLHNASTVTWRNLEAPEVPEAPEAPEPESAVFNEAAVHNDGAVHNPCSGAVIAPLHQDLVSSEPVIAPPQNDEGSAERLLRFIQEGNNEGAFAMLAMDDKVINSLTHCTVDGTAPLHVAMHTGNCEIATYLLEKLANLGQQNNDGQTPLALASSATAQQFADWPLISFRGGKEAAANWIARTQAKLGSSAQLPLSHSQNHVVELFSGTRMPPKLDAPKIQTSWSEDLMSESSNKINEDIIDGLGRLIGNKKSGELYIEIKDLFTRVFKEALQLTAPEQFRHFIDYRDFHTFSHVLFVFSNPFLYVALQTHNKNWCNTVANVPLKANFLPNSEVCFALTSLPGPSRFQRTCQCLDPAYLRFFLDLTDYPRAYSSAQTFRQNAAGHYVKVEMTYEQIVGLVDTTGLFVAEVHHAAIHQFIHAMLFAMDSIRSKLKSTAFEVLYTAFFPAVEQKNWQVYNLLMNSAEDIANKLLETTRTSPGILTNISYTANSSELAEVVRGLFVDMGQCKKAPDTWDLMQPHVTNEILEGLTSEEHSHPIWGAMGARAKHIPPVGKHIKDQMSIIPEWAEAVCGAFSDEELANISQSLQLAYKENHLPFHFTTLAQFLQVWTGLSMIHATTLSFTRLFATPGGLSGVEMLGQQTSVFTEEEAETLSVAAATMAGLQRERQAFPDFKLVKQQWSQALREGGGDVDGDVLSKLTPVETVHMMEIVDRMAHLTRVPMERSRILQQQVLKSTQEAMGDEFNERGWMLADYFPAFYSVNQLTFSPYV